MLDNVFEKQSDAIVEVLVASCINTGLNKLTKFCVDQEIIKLANKLLDGTIYGFLFRNKTDIDNTFNFAVSKSQEMYESLNENERNLIENMAKYGNNTEDAFNGIKKEVSGCLYESFSNSNTEDEKNRWGNIMKQVDEMKYKEEDGIDNIIKLYQIKNTIN